MLGSFVLWDCYGYAITSFISQLCVMPFLEVRRQEIWYCRIWGGISQFSIAHCFLRNAWHSGYSFIAYYNTVLENGSNFVPQTQSHRATWHNNDLVSHATSKRTSPDKMIESPSVASDNQTSWSCPLNVHIKEVRLYYWRGEPINSHCTQYDSLTCIWYIPWTGKPWGVFAE